jgi:hypothetical protein
MESKTKRFRRLLSALEEHCSKTQYVAPTTRLQQALCDRRETPLELGHSIMDNIREKMAVADEIFTRTKTQRFMHDKIVTALCKFVYKSAYSTSEAQIKEYNGIDKIETAIALSGPRRFGKTETIVFICAVLVVAVPNIEITIISQSGLAAGTESGILGKIKAAIARYFPATPLDNVGDVNNKQHLSVTMSHGDVRKVHSYSSKSGDAYVCLPAPNHLVRLFYVWSARPSQSWDSRRSARGSA